MAPELYAIIPCYNEEKVLPVTLLMFRDKLNQMYPLVGFESTSVYYEWHERLVGESYLDMQ